MHANGEAVLENVRRYRAIASLYRQTAAFRPLQSYSLLGQAREWEHRAMVELEIYFEVHDTRGSEPLPQVVQLAGARWETLAAA